MSQKMSEDIRSMIVEAAKLEYEEDCFAFASELTDLYRTDGRITQEDNFRIQNELIYRFGRTVELLARSPRTSKIWTVILNQLRYRMKFNEYNSKRKSSKSSTKTKGRISKK